MTDPEKMKVSVCMIAYNQQEYIAQAIDSILAQKTSFSFELVIGDDNSKDDTRKICEAYAVKFPGKLRYYHREKNMGMMPNFIDVLGLCRGQYIAICEGDDYWIDGNKLQEQADFLDANPGFSFCCHNHSVRKKDEIVLLNQDIRESKLVLETEDYMRNPFFHMASYFFRAGDMPKPFPEWYSKVLAGDHFLVLFLSMKGKIGYINKTMSVFRNHGSSVSFTRRPAEIKQNFVHHLELFDGYSGGKYHKTLREVIRKWDLVYKVYEPVGYFQKVSYFSRNLGFYFRNFRKVGGVKLLIKYMLPESILRRVIG